MWSDFFSPGNVSTYQCSANPEQNIHQCTQRNLFEILLNQTEIRLYLPYSNWFGTKRTSVCALNQSENGKYNLISVWFNRERDVSCIFHNLVINWKDFWFQKKNLKHTPSSCCSVQNTCKQSIFEVMLNETKFGLQLHFSDWWTKLNSVWCRINRNCVLCVYVLVRGFFAVGQFAVRKNASFG